MFEHSKRPLASSRKYVQRQLKFVLYSLLLLGVSLGIGIVGYHYLGGLGWIDSLLNASMILTGMGPVNPMQTDASKIFASFYALFSGVAFLTMAAVMFAPLIHRFLHKMNIDIED
ncbi:MAG: hypothetical protein K1X82_05490 [Bacteroidia bacterium]|nr:hypothetical protein [Bacteroidia bacterium]